MVTDTDRDNRIGRHVFQHACWWAHAHLATFLEEYPIALQKRDKNIKAVASREILPGCLRIPVFCMRDSSYILDAPKTRSPHEVVGKIKWKQPVNALTERSVEVCCFCQPARRQPSGKMKGLDSDRGKDCHPFWHIRRSNEAGTCNSSVVGLEIKVITSSGMAELKTADNMPPEVLCDYAVTVPCIVNTKKLKKRKKLC